jgi:hypothetical protein
VCLALYLLRWRWIYLQLMPQITLELCLGLQGYKNFRQLLVPVRLVIVVLPFLSP